MTVIQINQKLTKSNISFREFLMLQCLHLRRWSLLSGFILYAIFATLDLLRFPPEIYHITISMRLFFVFIPLALLNYIYWFRPPNSITAFSWLLLFVYLGAGLNHSLIHYYAELHQLPFSQLGLVLIIMFGCLLTALPIMPTLIVTLVILFVYGISSFYFDQTSAQLFLGLLILGIVSGLCLLINRVCQVILLENYQLIQKLYGDSITDGLTTLFNRRFFETQLTKLCELGKQESKNVSLLFIDLDHFKKINDQQGHVNGDMVLQEVALVLKLVCRRPTDYAFRVGGDEFAILFYGISEHRLHTVCKEILTRTALINLPTNSACNNSVSLSIGGAIQRFTDDINCSLLLEQTDKCLYQAKKNGRNTYVFNTD